MSVSAMLIEMYEDLLATRDELVEELKNPKSDRHEIGERLDKLNDFLGSNEPKVSVDPIVDEWERRIAAGEEVDFRAHIVE